MQAKAITLKALSISGETADENGAMGIQAFAEEKRMPIVVIGSSKYHTGRVFFPTTLLRRRAK